MMQTIGFPAGGRQIDAKGSFFRYETGNAAGLDEAIKVTADGNDLGTYWPGDSIELDHVATRWIVTPITASTIGTVRIGLGRVQSTRLVGTVQVVDGGKARTLAMEAFIAYISQSAGAGNVPVVQLLNPANSGKRVIVKRMRVSTPTAGNITLGRYGVALPSGPFDPKNKLLGGPTSAAKMYRDTPAAIGPGASMEAMAVGAGLVVSMLLEEPYVLNPGEGIVAWHNTVTTTILIAFEFIEESAI